LYYYYIPFSFDPNGLKNNFLAVVVFFDLLRRLLLVEYHCGRVTMSDKSNIILGIKL